MPSTTAPTSISRQPAWIHYGLLILAVLLVGVTATLSLRTTAELKQSIAWVAHSQTLRRVLSESETLLAEAHSEMRAYMLSGEQGYLESHLQARSKLRERSQTILAMVSDHHEQAQKAQFLIELVRERNRVWDRAIEVYAQSGQAVARAEAQEMGGLGLLEAIRVEIAAMEQVEVDLHNARWQTMQVLLDETRRTIVIANLLALVAGSMGLWLSRRSRLAWERQRLAEMQAARARKQSEEKSLFLANMSHEIRTPMNAIFGFTQLLGDVVKGPRERQYVQAIAASGESLLALIDDILDLSKIEAGQIDLNPAPTDPRELIDSVLTMFIQLATDRRLSLRADVAIGLASTLQIDPVRVRQVLTNLVSNALKYTDQGGVLVRAWSEQEREQLCLHLSVEDSGIGIPSDQLESVFEPFVRGEIQGQSRREGTGLGLSITRRLVSTMGGKIQVASKRGRGAVFEVSLPTRAVEPAPNTPDALQASTPDSLPPLKILIVDDVARNRELMQAIFADGKHSLCVAENGAQALQIATEQIPDVVLMDIRMPVLDGHSALLQMRADSRLAQTRVIAVTASSLGSDECAQRADFDGYVRKPFTREALVSEIASVLGASALEAVETELASAAAETLAEAEVRPVPADQADSLLASEARAELVAMAGDSWRELSQSLPMRELGEFANRVLENSRVVGSRPLYAYAKRLQRAVQLFDVVNAESLLSQYPKHLHDLGLAPNEDTTL